MENSNLKKHAASFRDPSGFIFIKDSVLYRQVNKTYRSDYEFLMQSGLYQTLAENKFLISHEEVDITPFDSDSNYKILKPEPLPFISYPYEWCFSQLKDAAILTLQIQKLAIMKGMSLKDASAYNIQFHNGKPIFIDTLSFEKYIPGKPWPAYRQFCQHFLAPLALMKYCDVRLGKLMQVDIDGIPLEIASQLLPRKTYLSFPLFIHIHLHAKSQKRYSDKQILKENLKSNVSTNSMLGLVDSLENAIRKLKFDFPKTEWGDYYDCTNYIDEAMDQKTKLVNKFIGLTEADSVWDIGANTGFFSRLASGKELKTVAFDIDPVAVEKNYLFSVKNNDKFMLPLIFDLHNPSPSIGWMNRERQNIFERGPVDLTMALAIIHHLAISNNLPFDSIINFFHSICKWLIIEFVPKSDSQVQRLLKTREDIFRDYDKKTFESELVKRFYILEASPMKGSERWLYLAKA